MYLIIKKRILKNKITIHVTLQNLVDSIPYKTCYFSFQVYPTDIYILLPYSSISNFNMYQSKPSLLPTQWPKN